MSGIAFLLVLRPQGVSLSFGPMISLSGDFKFTLTALHSTSEGRGDVNAYLTLSWDFQAKARRVPGHFDGKWLGALGELTPPDDPYSS